MLENHLQVSFPHVFHLPLTVRKEQYSNICYRNKLRVMHRLSVITSPFEDSEITNPNTAKNGVQFESEHLPLTTESVELVLDEVRPFLKADGGNVKLTEIDGFVVKLELVGACGTCPSSSMTMKMGLERKLKERIPEIEEVKQTLPSVPIVTQEAVELVLDGIRPFLSVAGGKISATSITTDVVPKITLKMEGTASALQSVKFEITQRLQRHFMQAIKVEWK